MPSFRKAWPTFVNGSCGGWIRLAACLLGVGIILGLGVTDVQAGIPVATGERAVLSGAVQAVSGVTSVLHPFTQNLLIVSGVMLVGLLMVTGWEWFCRRKLFVMRPYEMALQQLESTQHRVDQGKVSNPRRAVLGILWNYVQEQYQLRLPEAGRDAILRALTQRPTLLSPCQKLLLGDALDSISNAPTSSSRWFSELTDKASLFVWATAGGRVRGRATSKSAMGQGGRVIALR